jgi:type II secretory pathway pseudopilin PulG
MITNNQKPITKNQNLKNGYTLVELLAVTGIIVAISGLIAGILYSSLRGGNKSKVTNDVSQNGNYALSVISGTILDARAVTKIGGTAISNCTLTPTGTSIEFQRQNGSLIEFLCDIQTNSIASTSGQTTTYLIDNNSVKVDPATCSFTCKQANSDPYASPIVDIVFTVSQRQTTSAFENVAASTFNTSVTMRNYNPR